jgi:hypothetical protein
MLDQTDLTWSHGCFYGNEYPVLKRNGDIIFRHGNYYPYDDRDITWRWDIRDELKIDTFIENAIRRTYESAS